MDKNQEIINKILEIPLDKWNGYETELNGKKVIYHPTHSNYNKFFTIDGVELYGEGVNEFGGRLREFRHQEEQKERAEALEGLHQQMVTFDESENIPKPKYDVFVTSVTDEEGNELDPSVYGGLNIQQIAEANFFKLGKFKGIDQTTLVQLLKLARI